MSASRLPAHSPQLNGYVERARRTHTEKFYEVVEFSLEVRQPETQAEKVPATIR